MVFNKPLTLREKEFLMMIYECHENNIPRVSSSQLALCMYVSLPAISNIIKQIRTKTYNGSYVINYQKGNGVKLTQEGLIFISEQIRNRRLIEIFIQSLGYDFFQIQQLAGKTEVPNKLLLSLLKNHLNINIRGERCCHGYLIPESGLIEETNLNPLTHNRENTKTILIRVPEFPFYYISRIKPHETKYIMNVFNNNLILGAEVTINHINKNNVILITKEGFKASLTNKDFLSFYYSRTLI